MRGYWQFLSAGQQQSVYTGIWNSALQCEKVRLAPVFVCKDHHLFFLLLTDSLAVSQVGHFITAECFFSVLSCLAGESMITALCLSAHHFLRKCRKLIHFVPFWSHIYVLMCFHIFAVKISLFFDVSVVQSWHTVSTCSIHAIFCACIPRRRPGPNESLEQDGMEVLIRLCTADMGGQRLSVYA